MNKFRILSVFVVLAMLFSFANVSSVPAAPALAICGTATTVTLFAGQHIDAGTVTVSNDANNLYVTFTTSGDWWLDTTHLHVALTASDVPAARNGNPIPGQFDYQTNHDPRVQTFTYTVAKSAIEGFDPEVSGSLVIAAHAALVRIVDGEVVQTETGWGNGPRFVDRGNWATYIEYEWQTCNGGGGDWEEVGTAYAYGGGVATCFLNLSLPHDLHWDTFNNWGWSNGPLSDGYSETWNLYAGAGQCDLSKGTLVGEVTVDYSNGTATVTYNMDDPYVLGQTHVYVGSEPMPTGPGGHYTSAPGQFTSVNDPACEDSNGDQVLEGCTEFSYSFSVSGDIYVLAHAVVYEPAP